VRCVRSASLELLFFFVIDKPKEAKKDTFLEKLATQVIKNVQVKITDIHIKYEDDVSNFSILLVIECVL
jgi:hypothetical protein